MNGSLQPQFMDPDQCSWQWQCALHIWKFPVAPANFYLLNTEEQQVASRFRFDEDRMRFSAGRQSLRLLLARYLSVQPEEIVFSVNKNQKPVLQFPLNLIQFNLSHSGGWVFIAVSPVPVGVDIEMIDEDFTFQDIVQEHFDSVELDFISCSQDPLQSFYYLWTRKEALTKAWGTGLQENLKSVEVMYAGSYFDNQQNAWQIESLMLSPSYAAAFAYSGEKMDVFYYDGSHLNG